MAEKLTPESAENGATAQHNIANVNEAINDGNRKRLSLDQQIASLVEKHITPLKEELASVVKDQKKVTGISSKDLNLFYKVFKRQEEAKLFIDDDDGRDVLDHMRVLFEAMTRGGQLDFVDAINEKQDNEPLPQEEAA